jgi:predicted nuclease of predicted toxin-antitoxin system
VRFLADESCDHSVVRALRAAGHDVRASTELTPAGEDDDIVIAAARDETRVLLTEDRDFGRLVYAQGHATGGVLYLRVQPRERALLGQRVVAAVQRLGHRLSGAFVVLQGDRIRWGRPPRA